MVLVSTRSLPPLPIEPRHDPAPAAARARDGGSQSLSAVIVHLEEVDVAQRHIDNRATDEPVGVLDSEGNSERGT